MARILFWCMLALTGLLLLQAQGEGEKQSPINIQTANVQNNEALGVLNKGYSAAHATMINKGYEIQVAWSEYAGSVVIEGVEYKLSQSHWHQPSEHTINGLRYPFELHMVHISDDGSIAVIGILYEFGKPDDFLTKLEWAIHKIGQPHAEDIDLHSVNPNDIGLRRDEAYYRYSGSLTTYPFNEEVTWTVIKHPKTATPEQVRDLWNALNGKANSREVQALNGRVVEEYEPLVDFSETYKAEQTILSGSS
ncbi:hypothetical protein SUGI_0978250 [Cryptomeria japonica]|nr:hypothetical protein SUGI_0978250 [Cryptomeria japonica]